MRWRSTVRPRSKDAVSDMAMHHPIGLARGEVSLASYDPRWPLLFEQEASLIRATLGTEAAHVEHIGSTAVPGLVAKPVIDIMLAIPHLRAPASFYERLSALDYDHRPIDPLPERLFFAKDTDLGRTHNLSVCEAGSRFWVDHLRFRDRLRVDADLASAYVALKRTLAARFPADRIAYTDGKDRFVADALAIA
jgi:GrpB-like predicted nucleotidyltransferase (UPF0157 family)